MSGAIFVSPFILPFEVAYSSNANSLFLLSRKANPDVLYDKLIKMETDIKSRSSLISLEDAIIKGIKNSPDLAEAFSTIQQYEWSLIAAKRKWFPTITMFNGSPFVGYNWTTYVSNQYGLSSSNSRRSASSFNTIPTSVFGPSKNAYKGQQFQFQPGLSVSWDIVDFTRAPDINSAVESLNQQKYLFTVSARSLINQIQTSYYQIQKNQQLIESFKEIYSINREQLKILDAQRSIGMATILDTEQTRSQIFSQLSQLVQYTQDFIDQTSELSKLLGLPSGSMVIPSQSAQLSGEWTENLEDTITLALEQREEIKASLSAAKSAEWSGISLIRSYLPSIQLTALGSLDLTNGYSYVPVDTSPSSALTFGKSWSASAGIGFTWSIFDGGINSANSQSSYAESRSYKYKAEQDKLDVVKEVESTYSAMLNSRIAVASAKASYSSSLDAQTAARARFAAGIGDITSVVQSIQLLSRAAQQVANAVYSYNKSVSDLYRYTAIWPKDSNRLVENRLELLKEAISP